MRAGYAVPMGLFCSLIQGVVQALPQNMNVQEEASQGATAQCITAQGATVTIVRILPPVAAPNDDPNSVPPLPAATAIDPATAIEPGSFSGIRADSCVVNEPNFSRANVCSESGDPNTSICCPSGTACDPDAVCVLCLCYSRRANFSVQENRFFFLCF